MSVVLFHLGGVGLPKLGSPLIARLTSWGWTGVEVFFVISGFVIPFVMMKGDYHWRDGGNFLVRRFVRIWPPSAILIALTVAQYAVIDSMRVADLGGMTKFSAGSIVANLFYVTPYTDYGWLNGILWTLLVEFQFYLFLALVFPLLSAHRAWLATAGAASVLTALLPIPATALFLKFAIYFAMGGVALLYRERHIKRATMLILLAVMALAAGIGIGWLPSDFAVGTALVIALVPIRSRLFVFLGKISYSLYLVHVLAASTAEYLFVLAVHPTGPIERFAGQLVCLAAAIVSAWIFYLLVERYFVDWSQRLAHPKALLARGEAE